MEKRNKKNEINEKKGRNEKKKKKMSKTRKDSLRRSCPLSTDAFFQNHGLLRRLRETPHFKF